MPNIDNIDIRNRLKVECPDILKQAGISQVDFGKLFLHTPTDELLFNQAQNIANNAIDIVNGAEDLLSMETVEAINNTIQFIISDLIKEIIAYCTTTFKTYISPEFAVKLATDIATKTLMYTKEYTKNPAQIIKELLSDVSTNLITEQQIEALKEQTSFITELNEKFANTQAKVKEIMDKIQPYSGEIAKYMKYGPDYVSKEIENIYNIYLHKGRSIVDNEIGKIVSLIDEFINKSAMSAGQFAADQLNKIQEKTLLKATKLADKAIAQVKIQAMAIINKTIMQLLALLGG